MTSADSHLTAVDELDLEDLAGEVLIVPQDDVLGLAVPGSVAPAFTPARMVAMDAEIRRRTASVLDALPWGEPLTG